MAAEDVIDMDGDAVVLSVRGTEYRMLAADEVDEVHAQIRKLDKEITDADRMPSDDAPARCPDWEDENGETQKFTYGRGDAFIKLLQDRFTEKHKLNVNPGVAWAIWCKLKEKAKAYQDFFENGSSSRPPSDSPHPTASADAAAAKLLSIMQDASERLADSKTSTTASVTPSTANAT